MNAKEGIAKGRDRKVWIAECCGKMWPAGFGRNDLNKCCGERNNINETSPEETPQLKITLPQYATFWECAGIGVDLGWIWDGAPAYALSFAVSCMACVLGCLLWVDAFGFVQHPFSRPNFTPNIFNRNRQTKA